MAWKGRIMGVLYVYPGLMLYAYWLVHVSTKLRVKIGGVCYADLKLNPLLATSEMCVTDWIRFFFKLSWE